MAITQATVRNDQLELQRRGFINVSLTSDSPPDVEVGSTWEIGGSIYEVGTADETPSGWSGIANDTQAYIKFTASGGALECTTTAPSYSSAKGGWYSGNDRYLARVYKDGSGNAIGVVLYGQIANSTSAGITFTELILKHHLLCLEYVSQKDISSEDSEPAGIEWKPDGTKLWMIGEDGAKVYEYSASAWDITTISFSSSFDVSSEDPEMDGITWKPDGTKFWTAGKISQYIYEYDVSTAWDLTTASYSTSSLNVGSRASTPKDVAWKPDGTKFWFLGSANDDIYEYDVSTAWDITAATYSTKFSVKNEVENPSGMHWKQDGKKVWVVGIFYDKVNEYILSTPWNVATASFSCELFVESYDSDPFDIAWKPDGTKMWLLGQNGQDIYEFEISQSI